MKPLFNQSVNKHIDELNGMNYFPAADKDTGFNISKTLSCLEDLEFNNLKDYLGQLSKKVVRTGRGSSGNLLAVFILGLYTYYSEDLTEMCKKAAEFTMLTTYGPQEGALLSALAAVPEIYEDYIDFLDQYIKNIEKVYETGWRLIPILAKQEQRDAGTLGLIYILRDIKGILEKMKHVYCVELLFEGNHPEIKEKIKDLGTNIILIPISEYTKLHIHTDDYNKIFEAVKEYNILNQKVDDTLNP